MPDGPQGESLSPTSSTADMRWLEQALFISDEPVLRVRATRTANPESLVWTALPLRGTTRRLVPATGRFAAQAFANDHDAMSDNRRLLGRVTRTAVRSGFLRLAPQVRADRALVLHDAKRSVLAAAAQALGRTVASCAITLGPRRYNRKPVVQLIDDQAQTVGFLKVGADALTSAMVATEAESLARLATPAPLPLVLPRVIWQAQWQGRTVACFEPVSTHGQLVERADPRRLAHVAQAVVAAGGGPRDVAWNECALLGGVRDLAIALKRDDVLQLLDRADKVFGDQAVSIGQWHGDFSPWNMISTASSTGLFDWEFASSDMAIGADLLHQRVMVATHLEGVPASEPLQQLLSNRQSLPELHAMGIPVTQHPAHLFLYLGELIRRDLDLARHRRPSTGFGDAAYDAAHVMLTEANQ